MLAECAIAFQSPMFTVAQQELNQMMLSATGEQKIAALVASVDIDTGAA